MFKVGDRVICIFKINPHSELKIGGKYTVSSVSTGCVSLEETLKHMWSTPQFILDIKETRKRKIKRII